jgi:hypothetical protein
MNASDAHREQIGIATASAAHSVLDGHEHGGILRVSGRVIF